MLCVSFEGDRMWDFTSLIEFKAFRNSFQPPINKLISKTKTIVTSIQNNYVLKQTFTCFLQNCGNFFCLFHRKENSKQKPRFQKFLHPIEILQNMHSTSLCMESRGIMLLNVNVCLQKYSYLP